MPSSIVPVLARPRQDIHQILTPQAILQACRRSGYSWRNRELDPVATISPFLLQILNGDTACQHVVHFGRWEFTASAFRKARERLPLRVLRGSVEMVAAKVRSATAESANWLGHRAWMIDGSGFSMPDVPQLQGHFGSPSGQRPGCGFPVGHLVGLFDLATGMLSRVAISPMRTHDMSRAAHLACELKPDDLVLGDTGSCSHAHLAILLGRGNHAVFRMHQEQIVDFRPGRSMPTKRSSGANVEGSPHSLWVRPNGPLDQVVIWYEPRRKPSWMTTARFAGLSAEIMVRELRYEVATPGFRARVITLVTTLLDPSTYPKSELALLYRKRWRIELDLRHVKITMEMDSLHCKTVDGVMKGLAMFALAYNLARSVMSESARVRGVAVDRLGFLDAPRWPINPIPGGNPSDILINPMRPDRIELRVIKRRMKQYPLMKEPRSVLRKRLLAGKLAA